jgi:hypothetical protein
MPAATTIRVTDAHKAWLRGHTPPGGNDADALRAALDRYAAMLSAGLDEARRVIDPASVAPLAEMLVDIVEHARLRPTDGPAALSTVVSVYINATGRPLDGPLVNDLAQLSIPAQLAVIDAAERMANSARYGFGADLSALLGAPDVAAGPVGDL